MRIKREINIALSALLFFTRLKFPFKVAYRPEHQGYLLTWFPAIGYVVGGIGAAVFYLAQLVFPQVVAVVLALVAMLLLTGAIHEDGLADVCDGFGGGYTPDRILEIMKDSSLGVYGTLGLILLFALKISLLASMPMAWVPLALLMSHTLSRWSVLGLTQTLPYARPEGPSKSRAISQSLSWKRVLLISLVICLPLCFLPLVMSAVLGLILLSTCLFRLWLKNQIGAYTGDCLGAMQQINELLVQLYILALCALGFV